MLLYLMFRYLTLHYLTLIYRMLRCLASSSNKLLYCAPLPRVSRVFPRSKYLGVT
jgi:hypothetical protein